MKALRTIGISVVVFLSTATPAFAATTADPMAKTKTPHYWFEGNWFLDLTFVGTSILLVVGFCLFYWFKVLRPKFRGRPVA